MQFTARLCVTVSLCLVTAARAGAPPPEAPPPRPAFLARQPADVQAGYALFVDKGCYLCHGHLAQGSPMSGPALLIGAPDAYLLHFVRVPRNQMPPYFPEVLSDADVGRIGTYLRAIPVDKKPADLPLLDSVRSR